MVRSIVLRDDHRIAKFFEERHQLTTLIHIEMINVPCALLNSIAFELPSANTHIQMGVIGADVKCYCRVLFPCMDPPLDSRNKWPFFRHHYGKKESQSAQPKFIVWIQNMMIFSNNWSNETIKNAHTTPFINIHSYTLE